MSYIDIDRVKEKALYRCIKEIEENGRSFIDRDTRIGQILSKKCPELIVTSNRRKNITVVVLPLNTYLEEKPYENRTLSKFNIRRTNNL